MLQKARTYQELQDNFYWKIPEEFNMAWAVCDCWAAREKDKTAIIDMSAAEKKEIPFIELKRRSDQLAAYLKTLNIQRGDRVGVFASQSPWTAIAHIAIWKIGAISIPLFKLFGNQALKSRLEDSGACAVVTDGEGKTIIQSLKSELPELEHVIVPEKDRFPEVGNFLPAQTHSNDPCLLIYTSGTTGSPKGALLPHKTLLGHLPGVEMSHNFFPKENDVIWTPADWAWIGGLLDVLMPGLYHGVPVVAARMDKFSAAECSHIINSANVRNIFLPATALKILKSDGFSSNSLRTIASGGEPLGAEMLNWGKRVLGLTINEFYGQTECNMVVSSCSALFNAQPGLTGRPVPGHDVAILDKDGNYTIDEGDIAIKQGSPVMMLKYWNNPKATKAKFRNGPDNAKWLITGDRGIAIDGFIKFIARDDDIITSAGYRIGPAEIEDCMMKHKDVALVGVVGKPDKTRTEIVKAYIVLKPGIMGTETLKIDLQNHVKQQLAKYEYPREIEFVTKLPTTITGKIIRKKLRERAVNELISSNESV